MITIHWNNPSKRKLIHQHFGTEGGLSHSRNPSHPHKYLTIQLKKSLYFLHNRVDLGYVSIVVCIYFIHCINLITMSKEVKRKPKLTEPKKEDDGIVMRCSTSRFGPRPKISFIEVQVNKSSSEIEIEGRTTILEILCR